MAEATENPSPSQRPWQVDLNRLIDILKHFTYANKDVAIRELISNAADSISQRVLEDPGFEEHRIHLSVEADQLVIEDTGDIAGPLGHRSLHRRQGGAFCSPSLRDVRSANTTKKNS